MKIKEDGLDISFENGYNVFNVSKEGCGLVLEMEDYDHIVSISLSPDAVARLKAFLNKE